MLHIDLSPWVGFVGGTSVVFLILFLFLRRRKQTHFEAIVDPMLKARAEIVLTQMGMPDIVVIPVHGAGLPVVAMHDAHLLLSAGAGDLLSDDAWTRAVSSYIASTPPHSSYSCRALMAPVLSVSETALVALGEAMPLSSCETSGPPR